MAEPLNDHAVPSPGLVAAQVERPELDNRQYRIVKLDNGLEALLIHDPDTDKASAALDVNVGSFSDAADMPGMAHAVEHLLFMGTKKFPVENAYNQYLAAHSGHSNAYTASTSTNYYFEVAASNGSSDSKSSSSTDLNGASNEESPLYGALDRFAQFFIAPLFLEDTLDRELRAVDSENKKNLQSDTWRLHQLNKSQSNPDHPFCHFSTGNYKTLHDDPLERGVKIRDEFIKFYETNYSANRMKLAVLGREDLDTLESWVQEFFTPVVNQNLPQNRWDDILPYTREQLATQTFAKPVFESRSLDLTFLYRDEDHLYESQPSRYISHLIGHEGPGSILAYIKSKGWANGLSAGPLPICPGGALFTISVRLTEDGLKQYKEVTKTIFQYISMLRDTPPYEWIVEELKKMSEVDFRFKQKSPASRTTSSLSSILQKDFPREWILSYPSRIRKFNPEEISNGLSLLQPENFRMTIISQDFPGDWNQKEKWYGTEYKTEKLPQEFLEDLKKAAKSSAAERPTELHLPHRNEFIPTRLEVEKKEIAEPSKAPKLIRNDENVRVWWKKDDQFWVPKANVHVTLRTPLPGLTPQNQVMASLYQSLVNDALVEYSYDAEISGLQYAIVPHSIGFDITVSGYNDKMPVLLEKVLVTMRDLEIKEDRFNIIKERSLRGYRNWDFQQPYLQVGSYSRWLNSETGWINEQYLTELRIITADDIRHFHPQLLRQLHIEVMAHGNVYKEDALKMTDLVESIFKPRKLPATQWPIRRSLIYPEGSNFVFNKVLKDPANINHCIEYMLYIGDNYDRDLRAKLLTFAQMTEEPVFDQLRTKEQLGYVVFSGASVHHSVWAGYRILIQSERSPEYLEVRIDDFLNKFGKELEEMSEEQFEKHKTSLINKRLEKLKNLTQESNRFWNHIMSECFDFEQSQRDVDHVRPLTKADMQSFFNTYISPQSSNRAKLSVHLLAQSSPSEIAKTMSTEDQNAKVLTLLTQSLNVSGISTDQEALKKRLESSGLGKSEEDILEAVQKYLKEDAKVDDAKAKTVLEQGKTALKQGMTGLGIEVSPSKDQEESATNGEPQSTQKPAVEIKNVLFWKAGLEVSKGARPMTDLSEFEELEPKL